MPGPSPKVWTYPAGVITKKQKAAYRRSQKRKQQQAAGNQTTGRRRARRPRRAPAPAPAQPRPRARRQRRPRAPQSAAAPQRQPRAQRPAPTPQAPARPRAQMPRTRRTIQPAVNARSGEDTTDTSSKMMALEWVFMAGHPNNDRKQVEAKVPFGGAEKTFVKVYPSEFTLTAPGDMSIGEAMSPGLMTITVISGPFISRFLMIVCNEGSDGVRAGDETILLLTMLNMQLSNVWKRVVVNGTTYWLMVGIEDSVEIGKIRDICIKARMSYKGSTFMMSVAEIVRQGIVYGAIIPCVVDNKNLNIERVVPDSDALATQSLAANRFQLMSLRADDQARRWRHKFAPKKWGRRLGAGATRLGASAAGATLTIENDEYAGTIPVYGSPTEDDILLAFDIEGAFHSTLAGSYGAFSVNAADYPIDKADLEAVGGTTQFYWQVLQNDTDACLTIMAKVGVVINNYFQFCGITVTNTDATILNWDNTATSIPATNELRCILANVDADHNIATGDFVEIPCEGTSDGKGLAFVVGPIPTLPFSTEYSLQLFIFADALIQPTSVMIGDATLTQVDPVEYIACYAENGPMITISKQITGVEWVQSTEFEFDLAGAAPKYAPPCTVSILGAAQFEPYPSDTDTRVESAEPVSLVTVPPLSINGLIKTDTTYGRHDVRLGAYVVSRLQGGEVPFVPRSNFRRVAFGERTDTDEFTSDGQFFTDPNWNWHITVFSGIPRTATLAIKTHFAVEYAVDNASPYYGVATDVCDVQPDMILNFVKHMRAQPHLWPESFNRKGVAGQKIKAFFQRFGRGLGGLAKQVALAVLPQAGDAAVEAISGAVQRRRARRQAQ